MSKSIRGLFALLFIISFFSPLQAEYLYKDEVIFNPKLTSDVETMGKELFDKTGIALRLVILKQLDQNQTIVDYEKKLAESFQEPTILLTFSEMDKKVDILARPASLYEYFNKKQVLSPTASEIQAFIMALFFSNNFEEFKDNAFNYGGTIIPLLAERAKGDDIIKKYSAALFNGYADIAEQVADSKHVKLKSAIGNSNKYLVDVMKFIFYSMVVFGIVMYTRKKILLKKYKNEKK